MRVLRFFALLLVVLIAFIATPTVEWQPLAAQLPVDLIPDSILFTLFHRWVTQDLARFALLLTGCAGLTFGLLTVPWPLERAPGASPTQRTFPLPTRSRLHTGRRLLGGLALLVALVGNGAVVALYLRSGVERPLFHGLWVGSILLLLVAAGLLTQLRRSPSARQQRITTGAHSVESRETPTLVQHAATQPVNANAGRIHVTVGWGTLLTLLLFAFLLYGWRSPSLPASVQEPTVHIGLHALTLSVSNEVSLFAPVPDLSLPEQPFFPLALTPTALFTRFSSDLLFGTRVAGLMAALLGTLGMWLVGTELFARRVDPISRPTDLFAPIEDNGRSLAALATLLFIANMGVFYYSRLPVVLTATAWGTLGCWALLRGIRLADRLALSLSGLLIGLALLFHSGALTFVLTGLLWWLGFGAIRLGLLPHRLATDQQRATATDAAETTSITLGNFLLWLVGILLVISPFLASLTREGGVGFNARFPVSPVHVSALFAGFVSPVPTYPAPLFNLLLLPLLPLAIGALLFNLDRRQGWFITGWLLSALGVASLFQQSATGWDALLPLIPAVVLAMTFALDRLRVTLLRVGVRWLQHFLAFFLLGLVLWTIFHNGVTYYTFAVEQHDLTSAVGHALRARAPGQQAIVLQQATETPLLTPDNPQLRFFTNGTSNDPTAMIQFATEVPEGLTPGSLILVPAQESYWLTAIEARYPEGEYTVVRDHYANPLLYTYIIAGN